jgi:DNA-binding transcriptional ArsR family regulator
MTIYKNISDTGQLISEPTRMTMLMNLSSMNALTAGELARASNISPQTASTHLQKLLNGNLIIERRQGRHKYYELYNEDVAKALESIANISGPLVSKSLNQSTYKQKLEFARTCYGHIAGKLGVMITNALINKGYLVEQHNEYYQLTDAGKQWCKRLDININQLNIRPEVLPMHIDWTVRQNHLAGPLSLAITQQFIQREWLKYGKLKRAILVTPKGKEALCKELDICDL